MASELHLEGLHPDTAKLVQDFADALAAKLRRAQEKYGYTNGWLTDDWREKCCSDLMHHVVKGDPLDVAAYAAFSWARGWSTTPTPCDGFVLVPTGRIDELLEANTRYQQEARDARAEVKRLTLERFTLSTFDERLKKLEAVAHEPFDFTYLIHRLETLEARS